MDMPRLSELLPFVVGTIVGNGLLYLGLGAAVHHAYYDRRAASAARWRLQPDRPMPTWASIRSRIPGLVPNLILFNGIIGATLWAVSTGRSRVVFDVETLGLAGTLLTACLPPVLFHVLAFAAHRTFHTPFLFKHVHSVHHRARTPTFVDALAMHPLEAIYSAIVLVAPAFLVPHHVVAFGLYLAVVGIHEFLDHSGIRFHYPLFSPSSQHDEHHRSVKVFYGQAFPWLDAWLGTDTPRSP